MGLSSNVQDMAQQFQAGQDMQTIQQGKGAEKQTYMKNRSGMGKVADFLTFGATSQFGSTGGRARRKANQSQNNKLKIISRKPYESKSNGNVACYDFI